MSTELDDETVEGVRMYRRMAKEASTSAGATKDPNVRARYVAMAKEWSELADELERFCVSGR
jgi:hypothetical protein